MPPHLVFECTEYSVALKEIFSFIAFQRQGKGQNSIQITYENQLLKPIQCNCTFAMHCKRMYSGTVSHRTRGLLCHRTFKFT